MGDPGKILPNDATSRRLRAMRDSIATLTAERDALRAQVEAMGKERRLEMRAAYKAGYETRKIGAGLSEGWATFFAGALANPTGSPDGQQ